MTVEVRAGRYHEPVAMTLSAYLTQEWLPTSAARVRPSTLQSYQLLLGRHAIPHLGHVALGDVAAVALTKLYGRLLISGRVHGGGGLSPRTVRYLHTVLRRAFADAVRRSYPGE